VLERWPGVRAAAVIDREDPLGETRLVAYIDANGAGTDPAAVRAFLSERIPNYMVPSTYVPVDRLPLTPNGKVDRDALPEPEWEHASAGDHWVAPRTDTERRVAAVWSGVLSVRDVGIHDNFFALGGHSLRAMQVMSRLREELGVSLTLRTIFDSPTVMELAAEVEAAQAEPAVLQAPALVRVRRAPVGRR